MISITVIEMKTTWDLTPLFTSDDDPAMLARRKQVTLKTKTFVQNWKARSDYLEKPKVLEQALKEYESLEMNSGSEGDGAGTDEAFYFWLLLQQDQNNTGIKARYKQAQDFAQEIQNEVRFFRLKIAGIPKDLQTAFLEFPGLKSYRHFLERSFRESQYLLSEPEEKILSLTYPEAHESWIRMVSGFLAKEEKEILMPDGKKAMKNFSELLTLMNNRDKNVRDSAAQVFHEIMLKHSESAEAELNAVYSHKKVEDELRKTSRPDFLRHLSDDLDSNVVDLLIESVSRRFDIAQKYYQLKARLLHVPKLEYHERNVEYGSLEILYPYEHSVALIEKVFSQLDTKFGTIFQKFVEQGRIDVYPRKGKRSGAFCTDSLKSQPTYVLLNHTNKLNDVTILAHEMGHAINGELMKEKLNGLNVTMPLSTAEVASTFMEDFVLQELLREADDELKLSILMMKLNDDISTIFRQSACYRFEQELHTTFRKKGYVSKEEIGSIFQKHMASYMGPSVEQSSGSENWWVYWGHIRNFFYVYSYASGLLISKALQASVKKDPVFIEKVKDFLASGISDSPQNIFLKLGIDITQKSFWEKGLGEIEHLLEETEALAKKLGKL